MRVAASNEESEAGEFTRQEILAHLKSSGTEHIDVYQMLAFGVYSDSLHIAWLFFRCLLAFCTQTFAIYLIMSHQLVDAIFDVHSGRSQCDREAPWRAHILMLLLLLCVAIFVVQQFHNLHNFGGYRINMRDLHNKPDFINGTMLRVGYYTNMLLVSLLMLASISVIWKQTTVVSRLLKTVAVFFILELDDKLESGSYRAAPQIGNCSVHRRRNYRI